MVPLRLSSLLTYFLQYYLKTLITFYLINQKMSNSNGFQEMKKTSKKNNRRKNQKIKTNFKGNATTTDPFPPQYSVVQRP